MEHTSLVLHPGSEIDEKFRILFFNYLCTRTICPTAAQNVSPLTRRLGTVSEEGKCRTKVQAIGPVRSCVSFFFEVL